MLTFVVEMENAVACMSIFSCSDLCQLTFYSFPDHIMMSLELDPDRLWPSHKLPGMLTEAIKHYFFFIAPLFFKSEFSDYGLMHYVVFFSNL